MTSRTLKLTLSSVLTLALASTAYAQDPVEGEEGMEGGGEATEGGEGGEAAPAEGGEAAPPEGDPAMAGTGQLMGPFTKETYPMELIYRPLTLVKGMIEIRGGLSILHFGDPLDLTLIGLGIGAGYGITDKLEVGLSTSFNIDPDAGWGENLGLYGQFSVIDQDKLDLAASVGTALSFVEGGDTFSGLAFGANTRFLINDKIFIRGGSNLLNLSIVSIADPTTGDESSEVGLSLNLNVGGGFQVNQNLAVTLDLAIASIKIFGDAVPDSTFFDPLGVNLGALYAINNKLDAVVNVIFPSIAAAFVDDRRD